MLCDLTKIPDSDDIELRTSLICLAICGAARSTCRPAKPATAIPRPTTTILAFKKNAIIITK